MNISGLKKINKKSQGINISGIKNIENNKTIVSGDKEIVEKEKSVFDNYQSDFEEKNTYIIENNKLPKTRYYLILPLILITILTVFLVFKYQPKVHNLNNYEIQILGKNIDNFDEIKKNKLKLKKIKDFLIKNREK